MKIAVAYKDGLVFNHFGRTENFAIYEILEGNIVSRKMQGNEGKSHAELIGLLVNLGIEVLFVGGIGSHAIDLLKEKGIDVYTGVSGEAEKNVIDFLNGKLVYNPQMVHECSHNH